MLLPAAAIDQTATPPAGPKVTIAQSSQSASLDNATCRIAREKVVFDPARDDAGRAVASLYALAVRWQIPPTPMMPSTDRLVIRFERGRVVGCNLPDQPTAITPPCAEQAPPAMPARLFGDPFIDIRQLEVVTIYQPGGGAIARPPVPGRRVTLNEVVFTLDGNGRVTGCAARGRGDADANALICVDPEFRTADIQVRRNSCSRWT